MQDNSIFRLAFMGVCVLFVLPVYADTDWCTSQNTPNCQQFSVYVLNNTGQTLSLSDSQPRGGLWSIDPVASLSANTLSPTALIQGWWTVPAQSVWLGMTYGYQSSGVINGCRLDAGCTTEEVAGTIVCGDITTTSVAVGNPGAICNYPTYIVQPSSSNNYVGRVTFVIGESS